MAVAWQGGLTRLGGVKVSLAAIELKLRYKLDEAREAIAERRKAQLASRGEQVFEKELEEVVAKVPDRSFPCLASSSLSFSGLCFLVVMLE